MILVLIIESINMYEFDGNIEMTSKIGLTGEHLFGGVLRGIVVF